MKAGVVGASGYLGSELLRLLAGHPSLECVAAQADSSAGQPVAAMYPNLGRSYPEAVYTRLDPGGLGGLDVVFVALPSGHSQDVVGELDGNVGVVVDLGADFRLKDAAAYPSWYGFEHSRPAMLAKFAYGLPELFRAELAGARLVATPGCYVTAAALALAPLVSGGIIEATGVVVDGASGTSGAGRAPSSAHHHPVVNESYVAYGLVTHRHTPEMEQVIGAQLIFTPHLAPMTRGILVTAYGRASDPASGRRCLEVLRDAYSDEPFVCVGEDSPSTAWCYGSNTAYLTARFDERTGTVVALSAIDNLVKGGSGQAIQAANLALGLPETSGLEAVGLAP